VKIAFIIMRFGKDGLATNIQELTRGLVKKGHEVSIITSGFKEKENQDNHFFDALKEEFKNLGVQLYYFTEPKGNPVSKILRSFSSLFKIASQLKRINADVIHCHSPNLTFIPWLLRKKFVSTVHADTIRPNLRYKHPTLLIAVSEGSKEFTKKVMGSPEKTIRMVYHGISKRFAEKESKSDIEKLKTEHNIPKDKFIIGVVGRITPQKGTDVLVDAIGKHLDKSMVDDMHIVIVGDYQSENQKEWLDILLHENQLSNKLTVLGFRDPKPFYQLFDVFVLPSRSDTFGLVAVEAMMSGCCTIRSNGKGAIDQIDHDVDGMIFPMEDAKTLALQLEEVLINDEKRTRLAAKGKEKALRLFTLDKMTENTLKVYEELRSLA
jgi:glycosyltransferase involved in cell wall biosynthesis